MKYSLITIIAILLMSSCSGTKDLSRARVEMPASYMSGDTVPQSADSLTLADVKWWEFYSDTTLTKILRTALDNNRDILKAAAKVEQMRALYGVAKADMLPQIGLDVAYSYETNKYNGGQSDLDPEHDLKFPISWEVNLWGAMFHAKNAGKARFIASLEDYRAMRMTLIAEVATAYFRLLSLENELAIVRQTLKTREEALKLAKIRFEGGLTSETVYQQAMVEYSSAASLIPDLELRVTSMRNSLTTLMGEFPRDVFENRDVLFDTDFTDRLPAGIPSDLLKRRPDLRAAEQRLKAAMADVGVSYADRFPSFRIGFTPGFENDRLKDFFKSPFTYTIAQLTGPIFDFGRRKKKYEAAKAVYDQSRFDYEKAVIGAFTEVNTSLTAYNKYRENLRVKTDLRDAAAKYVQLAWLQYRGGTLNYIDVLDAQRRYFESQVGVNNALLNEYLALINLYKALGGGWS
ncbi:MAG: TolC family protein [Muribaculaceae bacterium]|nr:TolC family protein [Muribaculaceae bacterium]